MASFLSTMFGGGAEKEAADRNRGLLTDYLGKGTGFLDKGLDASKGYLNDAGSVYTGLQDKYGKGSDLYLDSLGVNGPQGNANATGAFQAGPGYQFTLDQGLDAINRRRAAGGMLDSGNSDIDALKFGTGLADQTYGDWQTRLGGLVNPEMSAAAGVAGNDTNLANLYSTDAQNRIGLQGSFTSGNMQANNAEAAGASAGAKNLLGGALSLANLGLTASGVGGFGSVLKKAA